MILIKNGRIVSNNNLKLKDILINDEGKIERIENDINYDCEIINADGNLVLPGFVDIHVHLREPGQTHKETIKSGTMSAAKGGVTTIMPMPNLNPTPDNYDNLKIELDIINKDAVVNCYPYGCVTKGQKDTEIADIKSLAFYVKAITDDGYGVNSLDILEDACKLAKEYDLVVASHAEDKVLKYAPESEYISVRREIEIAKKTGCKYHFCHMSTAESFEAIRKAREEGYTNITCEVAPHHLMFNETMIVDSNWKMNPPLRSEVNRLATINALLDGTVSCIASDHAPHTKEEKSKPYNECPNGITGLETMAPIIITNFVKKGLITWDRFLDLMVFNPIKIMNLPERGIKVGLPADITIVDIDTRHTYEESEILSKGHNNPYIGMKFYGFATHTLVNGKVIYKK